MTFGYKGNRTVETTRSSIMSTDNPRDDLPGSHFLPNIKAKEYYVNLSMDINQFQYNLMFIIRIAVLSPTNTIILHGNGIDMKSKPQITRSLDFHQTLIQYRLRNASRRSTQNASRYSLVLDKNLAIGHYYIRFNLTSQIASKFLRCCKDEKNSRSGMLSSLKVLPYLNEKLFKINFKAVIVAHKDYQLRWNTQYARKASVSSNKISYTFGAFNFMSSRLYMVLQSAANLLTDGQSIITNELLRKIVSYKMDPLSVSQEIQKSGINTQRNNRMHRQCEKLNLKVAKQKWGSPYNQSFLIIQWDTSWQPGEFDFIAVFNKIPKSPFNHLPRQYYWIKYARNNTIVTDVVYRQNLYYYVVYYTYKRNPASLQGFGFTPVKVIWIYNNLTNLPAMQDDSGYAAQPHPRISPQDVNIKESVIQLQDSQNYTNHYPFLTASGQHTLDIGIDLSLTFNLNWYHPHDVDKWDYVAIYNHDPKNDSGYIANQWCWVSDYKTGFCNTGVQFDRQHHYFAAYISYDYHAKKYVIKESMKYPNHSHWMSDLKNSISKVKLRDLILPGTHDSACYDMVFSLADSWTQTQSETFENQLLDGIRYFDLRTEYKKGSKDKFRFVHNTWLTTTSVPNFLQSVKTFVSKYQEIIILDFNHFYYFNANIHDELIEVIMKHIGNDMAPISFTQDVIIGKMWDQNKRIIVAYDGKSQSLKNRNNKKLWPAIRSVWPNVDHVQDAKKKLDQEVDRNHTSLWVLQGILTPLSESIIPFSVQHLANTMNSNLNTWLENDWLHKSINIVISDFYLGNNVVSIAVQRNQAKDRALNVTIG
ncbi:uncharacterized protein TRIADDRAFT_57039 [Trichoplax adhaerens]|uniref:Phosphatidylinositol-specific phospholipase C X domain-containing protein n=1 Tax=Trichoplax adhaerens TaxID=10228 RepID=B3S0G4_TRIAD|nr:hypothetical protein TRIADDRAFT_57039 [Trichoplax adhaerens]EDV23633.1 hypothetical protein TRIADDRAFT_57039 [Trichoplax adhaerens]|eukprot:XP_002113159.1 hypothetical protein TRIADDRAFT_57039 [Trichoplax adhaerens]